jgi:hypothetical protein
MFMGASKDGNTPEVHNAEENLFSTGTPVTFVRHCSYNLNATVQVTSHHESRVIKTYGYVSKA